MSDSIIYGVHAVTALLNNENRRIKKLFVHHDKQADKVQHIAALAQSRGVMIEPISSNTLKQRFGDLNHQGVIALAVPLPQYSEHDLTDLIAESPTPCFVLILDQVTDPHNLGACLRTADAAGVHFVMIPKDNSVAITPVVSKVACGAAELIPLVSVTNLVRAMEILKQAGVWIYGAAVEAERSIYQTDFQGAVGLVMGAEGKGLRRLTREHCDALFSLPMAGNVESLNVSVATGISLFEVVRQRRQDVAPGLF